MDVKKVLGDRLLIKPCEVEVQKENGISIPTEAENLPRAIVVAVADELKEKMDEGKCPKPGEMVYYIHNARQPGRVRHKQADHYIVGIGQITAII